MLRVISSSLLLTLLSISLTMGQHKVSFGLKVGMNINNTRYSNLSSATMDFSDNLIAYHAGVYSKIKIAGKFFLLPELQFIKKGFSFEANNEKNSMNLSYIELPIITTYSPLKFISLELGPSLSVKVLSKTEKNSFLDEYYDKPFEFGLVGGIRFNITEKISITSRYFRGLTNISDDIFFSEDGTTGTPEVKEFNYNFQISAYYTVFQ